MDVTDKIIMAVIGLIVLAVGVPVAFQQISGANWSLTVGETSFNTAPLIFLIVIIVILGIAVVMYRNHK